MPFPYELYPKAKETHCLNLPEISVSRPPFPGSIRTADGCFWDERNNNSYVSDNGNTYLGSGYYWSDVFEEYTTADAHMECGSVPNNGRGCYIGCTCKSGWDGKKTYSAASSGLNQTGTVNANSAPTSNSLSAANVLDAAPSATSAPGDYSATASAASAVVASSSASGINSGISAMAAGGSCTISLTDPRYGTTCSKSGTFACPSGYGYSLDSCKKNQETKYQVCSVDSTQTNSTPCYSAGTAKTCSDENPGYVSACPSGQSGTKVTTSCGNTCYKDCREEEKYFQINVIKKFDSSCPTNFASAFNGISGCTIGGKSCDVYTNEYTISKVESGTRFTWKPQQSYSNAEATATTSDAYDTTVYVGGEFRVTYYCSNTGGGNSCTKHFGVSVTQVDRCTVRIDGTANFSSSYSGTILISVKYERKNVVNGKKTYEYFENLTINSGFSKIYASNQCKNTTTEQLIVTEFALRNTNLPDYNGCNVTADLINSAQ